MDLTGGIIKTNDMNFSPISNYNNYLKNNAAFDVDTNSDFENVLNQQQAILQNPMQAQGGVEINNFEDVIAKQSVQSLSAKGSTGNLMDSFSKAINGGLTSVNENVKAADRAQEAMAMGEDVSVHDVMIAAEKASLSLQMAMQLRNKMMNAYNELNNVKV